jgi:hypothetical protein
MCFSFIYYKKQKQYTHVLLLEVWKGFIYENIFLLCHARHATENNLHYVKGFL